MFSTAGGCLILSKLQLASRTQAALYAVREGLASLDADGAGD